MSILLRAIYNRGSQSESYDPHHVLQLKNGKNVIVHRAVGKYAKRSNGEPTPLRSLLGD